MNTLFFGYIVFGVRKQKWKLELKRNTHYSWNSDTGYCKSIHPLQ